LQPRISFVTLGVSDLERATKFYRDGLGLATRGQYEGVTFFDMGATRLALFPRADLAKDANVAGEGAGFAGFALAHNVATKEEVDAVMREAAAAGAVITKPAQDAFWGGYSGYFTDPDGFLWEVAWNPEFEL
jgi:catechol 2,3-dioxygenase-like lactoylglutathione lyase family enzyme